MLPIKGTGSNQEMQDFADGLAEDITAGLSKFPYLSIVARESTLRFAGQTSDIREISEHLGARYVIDGGIRKAGATIRVSMRLVDAQTGTNLWVETYTRNTEAQDIFATQDDITERVVATVADGYGVLARSMIAEIEDKPDEELTHAEWMLRTFDHLSHMTPESHAHTREGLEKAVKRFPRNPDVWACLSQLYLHEHCFLFNPKPDPLDRALEAAEKAIDLDRTCQFGYQLLAQTHFFRQDLAAFRAATERAISLNPLDSNTIGILGIVTVHSGDFERGAELTRRAMEMNPHHAGWYHFGPLWLHFANREYDRALARVIQVNMPGLFWTYLATATICGHLGREREARTAVRKLLELDPGFGDNARQSISVWHFTSGLIEPILDGLRKAGLDIPGEDPGTGRAPAPAPAKTKQGKEAVAIAVLPFTDMSHAKDQEFFCEGMAEEIMNALMHVEGLRVASRLSAFQACHDGKDLAAIGRALSVGEILEGSVRVAGGQMRVTAQLIDVESGYQLWSERYDRDAADVFAVQDEIAESVLNVIRARLSPDAGGVRQRARVKDLDAYRHHLKGRFYRYTSNDHGNALKEYERAIELDPDFGPAWVGMAEVRVLAAGYALIPTHRAYSEAREALARAEALQGESAEALYVEGLIRCFLWEWDAALEALTRSAEMRPDHVQTQCWLGFYWTVHQEREKAIAQFELARAVDPLASFPIAMMGTAMSTFGRDADALELLDQAHAMEQDNMLAAWSRGSSLVGLGRYEEAVESFELAADLTRRGAHVLGALGFGLAKAGRRSEAEAVLAELSAGGPDAPTPVSEIWTHAALGNFDAAWKALSRAESERQMMLLFLGMPGWDVLRSDPRFDDLLARMGLPAPAVREPAAKHVPTRQAQAKPSSFGSQSDIRTSRPGRFESVAPASLDSTAGDAAPRSLAVLPLANLSGDPQQEFFVAGMHDALINELARIRALNVISRTSTMPFAGSTEPLPEIAARLGVEAVIEGSVLKAGNQVRINLQLVNAHPEKHLWADSFDGAMEDILDLHRRVAGEVSSAVRARLTEDEEERLETTRKIDPQVYEIYLRARHVNVFVADDNRRGIKLYEQAIARDPIFAPAYAGMARNHVYLATLGAAAPGDVLPRAAEAAQRAIELDPRSGEARSIHGYTKLFLEWDWETAGNELKLAREMEPNNVAALSDSVLFLALTGSVDDSAQVADRIAELDPMSGDALFWQGWTRFVGERYEEAIGIFRASMEADPAIPYPPLWTGAAHGMMGNAGQALEWARKAEALDPESQNTDFLAVLGCTYLMGGCSDDTQRILKRIGDLETDDVKFPTQQGYLHGWLGEYDEAVEFYKIAFAERNPGVIFLANHPICDAPRSDPRIMKMVEGLGFPAIRPMLPAADKTGD